MSRPRPFARPVAAGWGTAVALGASTALLLFSALTVGSALWSQRARPTPALPPVPRAASADVDLWVGELALGVKAVLSAEWNHPDWDHAQDARWNVGLASPSEPSSVTAGDAPSASSAVALAFYALVAFNTSGAPVTLSLPEGAIRVLGPDAVGADVGVAAAAGGGGSGVGGGGHGAVLHSVDLAAWLAHPGVAGSAAATTLRLLGADRALVEVPPGKMLKRPVAFARRVSLADAVAVTRGDGTPFRRRRMARTEWVGLLVSPSVEQVSAL